MSKVIDPSRRRGQSLVLMILFLVFLAGILALTIDFGYVTLSRRTMQSAVNTAALQGARDVGGRGKEQARTVIRNLFDDDLDPTENLTTLGAGPDQSLVGRDANDRTQLGNATGSIPLFENRYQHVYRPVPQLNQDDDQHGDLVRGRYRQDDDDLHRESGDYSRTDFDVDPSGRAFLARLRRTPSRNGIADPLDRIDGVSSSGTGSPLLLGRLLPIVPKPSGEYDIRRDGVTIRATAIADSRPIVHVGMSTFDELYSAISYGYSVDDENWYLISEPAHQLGETVTLVDRDPSDSDIDPVDENEIEAGGYAAVLWERSGAQFVVGFRLRELSPPRMPNGSPRLQDVWQTLEALASEVRDDVLEKHEELADEDDSVLERVPALVRAIR